MTNLTALANRFNALKLEHEAIGRLLDEAKAEIKELGIETLEGDNCIITIGLAERSSLDQKLVKELLSADDLALCTKVTLVESIRVKSKVNVVQA